MGDYIIPSVIDHHVQVAPTLKLPLPVGDGGERSDDQEGPADASTLQEMSEREREREGERERREDNKGRYMYVGSKSAQPTKLKVRGKLSCQPATHSSSLGQHQTCTM